MAALAKVLIANRGEIVVRIARTCHRLGIATVAVYSAADVDSLHVSACDEAVLIGGAPPAESYLDVDVILDAAAATGADAVHPGYGFLAESAVFAEAVATAGLTFVGPPSEIITAMGDKLGAKRTMEAAGLPVLPWSEVDGADIGVPLMVKPVAGGGGIGMRVVTDESELPAAISASSRQADSAFGDGRVYLERFLERPRHIEVQILGDLQGRVIHLHERECSIQRRHQKVIEEAPAPNLDDSLRRSLHAAAVTAAKAIGYIGAGTVEFLVDQQGEPWFLEVNTRLQVEHPVTEEVLGMDLVAAQLDIAAGKALPDQEDIAGPLGHAIEARIYAEDPTAGFRPAAGMLHTFEILDDEVRLDSGVGSGSQVPSFYDPLLAKVVAWGESRAEAAMLLTRALQRARIHGLPTNRELLVRSLRHGEFVAGEVDTGFLARNSPEELGRPLASVEGERIHALAAALTMQARQREEAPVLPSIPSGWRNLATTPQERRFEGQQGEIVVRYRLGRDGFQCSIDGEAATAVVHDTTAVDVDLEVDGVRRTYATTEVGGAVYVDSALGSSALAVIPRFAATPSMRTAGSLLAPLPGTVSRIEVTAGDRVEAGTTLLVIESMKMEHAVVAPVTGTVAELNVAAGEQVESGRLLAVIEA